MKEKDFRVTDLLLDTGNYRTGKQADQREAIRALIEEQKNKLVKLAQDILENGLSPIERIMVTPIPDDKKRFIVIEGNRRVAAIKLLLQPDLAIDTTWHNAFKRLHKGMPGQVPKLIKASIVSTKEDGFVWIQRKHDNGLKGAGTESWSPIAKYRADAARGKSAPAIDVLEFVLSQGQLEADVQERIQGQDFPITNLERLLDSAYVSDQLDLDRGERYLTTTAKKKWVLNVLREFVVAVAREEFNGKKFSVKDIYSSADQKKFFNAVVSKHPKPSGTTKRWTVSADTTLPLSAATHHSGRKKSPHRRTTDRTKLITSKSSVRPPVGRANDIYHELRKLDVDTYRNAVSILLRVFLEFSVEEYMNRRSVRMKWPVSGETGLHQVCLSPAPRGYPEESEGCYRRAYKARAASRITRGCGISRQ